MFGYFKRNKVYKASILGTEHIIAVKPGKTLLSSALAKGISWPHKCKVGSCGTCKCMIISGKIKPNIDFGYVLAGDDIEKGYVLACQSELRSDIEVEITLLNKIKKEKK